MHIDNDLKLDFDDVLIHPKQSDTPSRSAIVLESMRASVSLWALAEKGARAC